MMDTAGVRKAMYRLEMAEKAYAMLLIHTDMNDFRCDWTDFLIASNMIFTSLEQGAKIRQKSIQWYVGVKKQRASDPLLQYIHEARNSNEHGLAEVFESQLQGFAKVGGENNIGCTIYSVSQRDAYGNVLYDERWPDGLTKPYVFEVIVPVLTTVTNKRKDLVCAPPRSHLRQAIDGTRPVVVANLALKYVRDLVFQAKTLVQ